jgi:hypothetical protein
MKKIKGYKGFDKDLKCRDKQYRENETFSEDVVPETCERGMHFCESPLDVFNYYPPRPGAEFAEVEAQGDSQKDGDKVSTNKLRIKSRISVTGLFKAHFDIVRKTVEKAVKSAKTNITSKDGEHASTSGNYGHASTSGDESHASTSGNYGHASTSGYKGHASTSGDESHASTSGNYGHASTSGNESIACTLGISSRASAKKGWIVLVDWRQDNDYEWHIHNIHRAKVGKHKIHGELIKPDTAYWFDNGKLKSE